MTKISNRFRNTDPHLQSFMQTVITAFNNLETKVGNVLGKGWNTDTALGAVGTKNPPINADKALYRDSTDSDALVTSTWTQIKAFLKTYFDTLFAPKASPTFTGIVTLPTGTTDVAPIKMVSGTNLTTPVAGTIEFDGTDYYVTI